MTSGGREWQERRGRPQRGAEWVVHPSRRLYEVWTFGLTDIFEKYRTLMLATVFKLEDRGSPCTKPVRRIVRVLFLITVNMHNIHKKVYVASRSTILAQNARLDT
jgi:hypothetical protein